MPRWRRRRRWRIVPAAARVPDRRRRCRCDRRRPRSRRAHRERLVLRHDRHAADGRPHVPVDGQRLVDARRDPQRVDGAELLQERTARSAGGSAGSCSTATGRTPAEIVGVAADSRADGIEQAAMHTMFQPYTQVAAQPTLLVRTAGASDRLGAARRRDDSAARSEPPDRSRADAGGNPRRNHRAAAAQRHADRPLRGRSPSRSPRSASPACSRSR